MKITTDNYEAEVLQSEKPVLLDFWADWCGPCKNFAPILEAYEAENGDKIKLGKVNVDEETSLAQQFRVMGIPTIVLMIDGEKKASSTGVLSKADLEKFIDSNL